MNTSLAEAVRLASDVVHATAGSAADVGVCPPAVWLDAVAERLRGGGRPNLKGLEDVFCDCAESLLNGPADAPPATRT